MKPKFGALRALSMVPILLLLSVLFGCAGMDLEYAPKGQYLYYHKELPAAERAVEAARRAGKGKECPDEFKAVEKMKNAAYETYWACRTNEAIAMANEVVKMANALCPPKTVVLPPPAPTVSLSASPASIQQGQCATLLWSSANAASASIDQGVGSVDLAGLRQVCPSSTTQYTIAAVGDGGSRAASTTVTVTTPPAPMVIDRLAIHVNFDFDKAIVRDADISELQKALGFVKKYAGYKISIEGHTDSIGTDQYNQRLSERRAVAVREYLLKHRVANGSRITSAGYGESKPIADNSTDKGRLENRRVEILILSE
ncbi:MAG: OmpA family protein [Candidatus Methylomirabilis sp.]